jgi:hypothetical protein
MKDRERREEAVEVVSENDSMPELFELLQVDDIVCFGQLTSGRKHIVAGYPLAS